MTTKRSSYDEIPYRSAPFAQSRPERLAAMARIFGLDSPPVERSRVLELGCASGGNLIAMAQDYPEAEFFGIDSSSRQIADGWVTIDSVGLKNIRLKHLDILDIEAGFGEFDYIISHGVFSWVPRTVQDKMLEICQRHLTPKGVAYISYNTYPGWHIRGIVRDMMHFHATDFVDPETRLAQAKKLVEFVMNSTGGVDSSYRKLLQSELKFLENKDDYYLHHDHLEENNHPIYFHQFAKRLAVNGLQYLSESELSTMVSTNFTTEVAETLQRLGSHDIVQMEQYIDFVRCRYFRQTLICRGALKLNRTLEPEIVKNLYLSSFATPVHQNPSLDLNVTEEFVTRGGQGVNCRHPLIKLGLQILASEWPRPVAFEELLSRSVAEAAQSGFPLGAEEASNLLAGDLLTCLAAGVVDWRLTPALFATVLSAKPRTTALARLQATEGQAVTNMRGEQVTLDEIHRQLLRLLDGTRDYAMLNKDLLQHLKQGGHGLHCEGETQPVTDENAMRDLLQPAIEKALENLLRYALLLNPQTGND